MYNKNCDRWSLSKHMQHLFIPMDDDPHDRINPWVALPSAQGKDHLQAIVNLAIPTKMEWAGSNCTIMTVTRHGLNIKGLCFSSHNMMDDIDDDDMERRLERGRPFFCDLPTYLQEMPDHASPITFTAITMHSNEMSPTPRQASCCFHSDNYRTFDTQRLCPELALTDTCSLALFVDDPSNAPS